MAVVVEDSTYRDTELLGLGLRERIEREHERRTDALDPISPELVLVLPAELAELARALLPDPPVVPRTPAVRPAPPAAEKPLSRERAAVEVAAFELFCVAVTFGPLLLLIVART